MDSKHYSYRVIWSPEDEQYVGLCDEFPLLSWLDNSQDKALRGIVHLVHDVIIDMKESGEPLPGIHPLHEAGALY
ncbi:antitoxin HicB [Chromobacterium phragmitis]|uniref:Antitoxin HicB n=1 Tax=Chromobacterium phragmitis TaxID=2202141 RepID=A0A344ULL0_9NEIS|nr:antitoxin HicB [Chromobacterium phragmitis]AXE36158.1 antitoxin HicB [Chromobacterium phragmitis]